VIPEQIVAADAAAMAEQIAHGEHRVGVRVGELEAGQVLANGVIPVDDAIIGEHRKERGGEGFRAGSEREDGVRRDLRGLPDGSLTEAFEQKRVVTRTTTTAAPGTCHALSASSASFFAAAGSGSAATSCAGANSTASRQRGRM